MSDDRSPDLLGEIPKEVLHSLGEGVSLANSEGRIVFSNKAADRILGVETSDAPPEEWAEYYGVFLPEDRTRPFPADRYPLVRALKGERTRDVEMWVRNPGNPDGALITVTGEPLEDEHGTIRGAAVVFKDITVLRDVQTKLERANAQLRKIQREKDELAAFVVHDLKSPITAIMLSAEFLSDKLDVSAEDLKTLDDIQSSAKSLHRMVIDLLDIRLAEDGGLQPERVSVNVKSLLEDVANALRPEAVGSGTTLEVLDIVDDLVVSGDPELLRRVIQNLVSNCLKYASGGAVRMNARPREEPLHLITVEDDGPGVPPDLRDQIFKMWTKEERDERARHRDSRGIGLYFSRLATEVQGGHIWVEDSKLGGARFCVELPKG